MGDLEFSDRVKRLVIIALVSDDELMEKLVLKGGNLLDIVYGVSARASVDIDFSTVGDFDLADLKRRVSNALRATFQEHGFVVFDVVVAEKPDKISDDMRGFWGGYDIFFKLIEEDRHQRLSRSLEDLRRNAAIIGKMGSTKFSVQISKFEFCESKDRHDLDGYTVYTYSPQMLVCEKIRAICQQMPEYQEIVHNHPSARARDFIDIDLVAVHFGVDFNSDDFREMIRKVFAAKKVSLSLIGKIHETREFHRADFPAVQDTVKANVTLQEFDFYFDELISRCRKLESLWSE